MMINLQKKLINLQLLKEKVDQKRPLPKEIVQELKEDFLIKSTYHSNAIEGNTLTLYETKAVLQDGITIAGKSMCEHLEAINHREAIFVVEEMIQKNIPFSEKMIKELHSMVLNKIDRENAGMYRNRNVIISGATHTPPHSIMVPQLMADLIEWYENAFDLHPVERAVILHSKFVNIHPFIDGNGRTARLLLILELIRSGYLPVIIEAQQRFTYDEVLDQAAVTLNYDAFVEFIADYEREELERYLRVIG